MSDLIITSPANPRLKALVALRRRRAREEAGTHPHRGVRGAEPGPRRRRACPRTVYYCPELMLDPDVQQRRRRPASARSGVDTVQAGPGGLREGRPTARAPTGSSPWSPRSTRSLRRPDRRPDAAGAALPGRREAGQPRRDAAHRRRGRRRGRHRRRPGHRLGQPQPGPRQQGHRVLGAGRLRLAPRRRCTGCATTASRLVATTPDTDLDYTDVDYTGAGGGRRRRGEVRPHRRGARRRAAARSASRWRAGPTRSTSPRRRRSSSTRRCASAGRRTGVARSAAARDPARWPPPSREHSRPCARCRACELTTSLCGRARRADRRPRERLAKQIGVDPVDGGVHPRFGTRNVILPLAHERYVEVVEVLDHPASVQGAVRPGRPGPLRGRRRLARLGGRRRRPVARPSSAWAARPSSATGTAPTASSCAGASWASRA